MNIQSQENIDSKIGLCGFRNIGNTCYLNSILQLIIHSKLFVNFIVSKKNPFTEDGDDNSADYLTFLEQGAIHRIGEKERKRLKLGEDDQVVINKSDINNFISNSIIIRLAEIINSIIYKGNSLIVPNSLKQIIDKKIPNLRGYSQQDAHELLIQLIDIIIEETGIESEPSINNVPNFINDYIEYLQNIKDRIFSTNSIDEKKLIIQELNDYKKKNNDIINKYNGLNYMIKVFKNRYNPMIFKLKTFIVNTITCPDCKNKTCNYENTTVLTLTVKSNLYECFESLENEEIIENYNCDVCKTKVNALKNSKIWRPAMTLFLHLKRFKVQPNGRILKDNTNIEIPHQLDLSKFYDESMKTNCNINYKYKLRGISNHHGNMGGGHYTADCMSIVDENKWYNFNDESVSRYKDSNINTSSAYILLYELEI